MKQKKKRLAMALLSLTAVCSCLTLSGCEVTDLPVDPSADPTSTQAASTTTTGTSGTQTSSSATTGTTAPTPGGSMDLVDEQYTDGLSAITEVELYENGELSHRDSLVESHDNKVMYYTDTVKRVINYTDGYYIDIPTGWQPDYSLSPIRSRYEDERSVLTVTKEEMIYAEGYDFFLEECFFRHIKNTEYLRNNNISMIKPSHTEQYGRYTAEYVHLRLEDVEPGTLNYYDYCILYDPDDTTFFYFMLKSLDEPDLASIVESFTQIETMGQAVYNVSYTPTIPSNWSEETKAYYEQLCSQDEVDWGIFTNGLKNGSLDTVVPGFEEKTAYKLPVVADYIHLTEVFPTALAEQVSAEGRVFQLSLQYTDTNNSMLNSRTASLEVYRGHMDDRLRLIARQIKAYGKPMLFRLNNEMNTDWTSYGGLINLLDPDIFIAGWERLYTIFEEEGVDNCIWIFNPTSGSYPPCNWANYLNYMPPAEHVHMLGLTEYVSGHSGFPSFESLYGPMEEKYMPFFGEYPWIIGEFACGTDDGTKLVEQATWVEEMFDCFERKEFPNIKVAVWFSGNDYNSDGTIRNNYEINQNNPLLMEAFRDGFARTH